jgi:hypothetical protein
VSCHMPKIEQTIADINVRSHTFNFIAPEMTDQYKIPNSCTTCHTDKSTEWARQAMKEWSGFSPWRVNLEQLRYVTGYGSRPCLHPAFP